VERATVQAYEERGPAWAARRQPVRRAHARAFAKRVPPGTLRIDLGCGAGRYTLDIGLPVVAFDAARAMLDMCRQSAPGALLVQGDLEDLPFGNQTLGGGWANMSYLHIPRERLPMALADLHRVLTVGAPIDVQVLAGDYAGHHLPDDDVGGRYFAAWRAEPLLDVFTGAGFDVTALQDDGEVVRLRATRLRTLPDIVGPGMRLLVVGLNPSLYAADAGVGFARPGNRFWPAAVAAGITDRPLDPIRALRLHGLGMTDLVKRATTGSAELTPGEYRVGMARVERLVHWLQPKAVCFVGLSGWRAAIDRNAQPGPQPWRIATRPAYVMPSTSGANAHAHVEALVSHLAAAAALADRS